MKKSPKPCEFCGTMLKYGYPGNDPENGPANYYCSESVCQDLGQKLEFARMWDNMSKDRRNAYVADIIAEDKRFEEMYANEEPCICS